MLKRLFFVPLLSLTAAGCVTAAPTNYSVPKERASECRQICTDLDMDLGAVVVIMSAAGCVCEPRKAEGTSQQGSGGAAVAGGAAIQAAARAAQQQQQSSR